MATSFYIRMSNDVSGMGTIEGPIATGRAAKMRAVDLATAYFGTEDVTWYERISRHRWVVGRRFEDGTRSAPFVGITVHQGAIPDAEEIPVYPYAGNLE